VAVLSLDEFRDDWEVRGDLVACMIQDHAQYDVRFDEDIESERE
jgi:hypothetical protein